MTARPGKLLVVAVGSLAVAGLTGCGGLAGQGQPDAPAATQAGSTLTVRFTPNPDASTRVWTLTCEPPGGDHPAAQEACATLVERTREGTPFASPSEGQICTQIYGGPQTAEIEGHWRGRPVSADYSRQNGCEIQTWDALQPVIAPGAASPPGSGTPSAPAPQPS